MSFVSPEKSARAEKANFSTVRGALSSWYSLARLAHEQQSAAASREWNFRGRSRDYRPYGSPVEPSLGERGEENGQAERNGDRK